MNDFYERTVRHFTFFFLLKTGWSRYLPFKKVTESVHVQDLGKYTFPGGSRDWFLMGPLAELPVRVIKERMDKKRKKM